MDILTFKMWEDAAANSAGGGGIDGIGVGAKGEPGVRMKKKKKYKEEGIGGKGPDWEARSRLQAKARTNMWKALGKKLKRK